MGITSVKQIHSELPCWLVLCQSFSVILYLVTLILGHPYLKKALGCLTFQLFPCWDQVFVSELRHQDLGLAPKTLVCCILTEIHTRHGLLKLLFNGLIPISDKHKFRHLNLFHFYFLMWSEREFLSQETRKSGPTLAPLVSSSVICHNCGLELGKHLEEWDWSKSYYLEGRGNKKAFS